MPRPEEVEKPKTITLIDVHPIIGVLFFSLGILCMPYFFVFLSHKMYLLAAMFFVPILVGFAVLCVPTSWIKKCYKSKPH